MCASPGIKAANAPNKSETVFVCTELTEITTSPICNAAAAAGEFDSTPPTNKPS